MVTQVTSFSRSGLSDWLIQRVTSLVLLAYFIFIGYHAVTGVTYAQWSALHDSVAVRVFTLMAVLSFAAHAWIGMWAVFTDYLTERMLGARGNVLRLAVQIATVLAIFALVLWVIEILWQ